MNIYEMTATLFALATACFIVTCGGRIRISGQNTTLDVTGETDNEDSPDDEI